MNRQIVVIEEARARLEEDLKALIVLSWEFEGLVVFLTDYLTENRHLMGFFPQKLMKKRVFQRF